MNDCNVRFNFPVNLILGGLFLVLLLSIQTERIITKIMKCQIYISKINMKVNGGIELLVEFGYATQQQKLCETIFGEVR